MIHERPERDKSLSFCFVGLRLIILLCEYLRQLQNLIKGVDCFGKEELLSSKRRVHERSF